MKKQTTQQTVKPESMFTGGEWKVIPARYSNKTEEMAFDICSLYGQQLTPICSILPKELCDKDYSGHLPNTSVSVREAEANARLIANAPAMYEALKELTETIFQRLPPRIPIDDEKQMSLYSAYHKAKAILNRINNQ